MKKRTKYQRGGAAQTDTTKQYIPWQRARTNKLAGRKFNSYEEAAKAFNIVHPGTGEIFMYPVPPDSTTSVPFRTFKPNSKGQIEETYGGNTTLEIMKNNSARTIRTPEEVKRQNKPKYNIGGLQLSTNQMLGANYGQIMPNQLPTSQQAASVAGSNVASDPNAMQNIGSAFGPIGSLIGTAVGVADRVGDNYLQKNLKYDEIGNMQNPDKVRNILHGKSVLNPIGSAISASKEGAGAGEVIATGLGWGWAFANKRRKRMEEKAKKAAHEAYSNKIRPEKLAALAQDPQYASMFAMGGQATLDPAMLQQAGMIPAEVEGGESMTLPTGDEINVQGPSHAAGGVDVEIPGGTRIYSDQLTVPGSKETFSDANKKLTSKMSKYEKILNNPKATHLAKGTARKMLAKLTGEQDQLFQIQQTINHNNSNLKQSSSTYAKGGAAFPINYIAGSNDKSMTGLAGRVQNKVRDIDWGNVAALAPALYNIGSGLFGKAESMNPEDYYNPYEAQALSAMKNRRINLDPIVEENRAAAATARYNLRSGARTRSELLGGYAPIAAGEARGNAMARMQAQQLNNQYSGETASMMANLGAQRAATSMQIADMNAQNKAAKRNMTATGLSQLGQFAQVASQRKNLKEADDTRIETLKYMYPEIWPELEKVIKGKKTKE